MMHFLKHLFIPHSTNNQRAKLLHNSTIFFIASLLLISSLAISFTKIHFQGVLGISANISSQELLNLTNQVRSSAGLSALSLNQQLSQAAAGKAQDMFTNNYWAHISPTGVTPWDFIRTSGYNYSYAGENLARGYSSAQDAMNAWMASPEHKANILSPNYTDVGFAVAQGNLTGDKGTILIVEEFGKTISTQPVVQRVPVIQQAAAAQNPIESGPTPSSPPKPQVLTQVTSKPLIDSRTATQTLGITLLSIFILILLLDMIIVGRRKFVRIVGHNLDHIIFFMTIIIIVILLGQGLIY